MARDAFTPAPNGTANEVRSTLMEAIATGQLRAGDRLPNEVDLAAQFAVATMTLRQALAQLRSLEYVETRRGRNGGTFVRQDVERRLELDTEEYAISVEDLRDLFDWRRAISGEAASLAANRANADDLTELQGYAQDFRDTVADDVARRLSDARFHIHVARVARSPRLLQAERELQEQLTRFMRIHAHIDETTIKFVRAGHDDIVRAIVGGDEEAARTAMAAHIAASYEWGIRRPSVVGHLQGPFEIPVAYRPGRT